MRRLLTLLGLCAATFLFLAPVGLMVATSLKGEDQLFNPDAPWFPTTLRWSNYGEALAGFPFWTYLRNTVFVCGLSTLGMLLSSVPPAYAFARLRWKGRDSLFLLVLATILMPPQATLLPQFLLFRALGWTGSYLPLVVPAFGGSALAIFLLRQFFRSIPGELSDAARLDGCGEWQILRRIILPLSGPALAAVSLLGFTAAWNDFLSPLIYLTDERAYTLAVGLQSFLGRHNSEWHLLMAAATVVTVPLMVLFLLAQKAFVQGVHLTGLKG